MRYSKDKRIGAIGLGNMGSAILNGLISGSTIKRRNLIGFDSDIDKSRAVKKRFGISIAKTIEDLASRSDILLIAVKPKDVYSVLGEISFCAKEKLYISIAAGIRTDSIERKLGNYPRVIRVMPNTPALVGEGMSVICKGRYATKFDLEVAGKIFLSIGDCVELAEKYFDLATAISGSGPAYFFYLIEALIEIGEDLGLKKDIAKRLVAKTALGSAHSVVKSKEEAEALRRRVTSKGGTTEAAIKVFERNRVKEIIGEAVRAAVKRSKEMASQIGG